MDCGFLILPVKGELETIFLQQDQLLAVLPEDHPIAKLEKVPIEELSKEPFMLLEKGSKSEISAIFEKNKLMPNIHFTTSDDYAVMSMVESGLGVSILPQLILKRISYHVAIRELDMPAYREIGLVLRDRKTASLAVKKFIEYLPYR